MIRKSKAKKNYNSYVKKLLFTPILPILFILNLVYFNIFDSYFISILMTIISSVFIYISYSFIKIKTAYLINSFIVSLDWFFIDFINFISNDSYKFLFSSIAETIVKNAVYTVI